MKKSKLYLTSIEKEHPDMLYEELYAYVRKMIRTDLIPTNWDALLLTRPDWMYMPRAVFFKSSEVRATTSTATINGVGTGNHGQEAPSTR